MTEGDEQADSVLVGRVAASPNHGERRDARAPDCVVLHYTGMADGPSALDWLRNPASQVSCHYLVEESGEVVQLVAERRRAWHAGRSCWHGETDMNSASIGIEIVNGGHDYGLPAFRDAQIGAVIALCRDIGARRAIAPERVLAHSDIAPARKRDPGERFPWAHLHRAGVGHWAEPNAGVARAPAVDDAIVAGFAADLARYGYDIPSEGGDAGLGTVVRAFQRHFRPSRVDGVVDAETVAILRALIDALSRRSPDAVADRAARRAAATAPGPDRA